MNKLVQERRALAEAMALGYRRRRTDDSHTNEMREAFIGVQATIEAIDRAIAHEKSLKHEYSERQFLPPMEMLSPQLAEDRFDQLAPGNK